VSGGAYRCEVRHGRELTGTCLLANGESQSIGVLVLGDSSSKDVFWFLDAWNVVVGHSFVKLIEIWHAQAGTAASRRDVVGVLISGVGPFCGVEGERGSLGGELGPTRGLESQWQSKDVAIEGDRAVHVADKDDGIVESHWRGPFRGISEHIIG
jgi:hypothetical protein